MKIVSIIIIAFIGVSVISAFVACFLTPEHNFYQPEILEEDEHLGI